MIGAANLAEVVSKLRERGLSLDEVREALGGLHLDVRPLSPAQALIIGAALASADVGIAITNVRAPVE